MWPPSDFLFNRCVPFFFGLRKSSLDFMFWSYIYFSFGWQTSGPKRFICVRWFFFHFLGFIFFLSGRDWIRGCFIRPNLCFYSRSSLVDVFFKRFLYSCRFIYNHSQRKRKKYSQNSNSNGFVFWDRIVFYFFEQNFF